MSAMRKSDMESAMGKIRKRKALLFSVPKPINGLQNMEMIIKSALAAIGMRFRHVSRNKPPRLAFLDGA
jgi:hypothetical protein